MFHGTALENSTDLVTPSILLIFQRCQQQPLASHVQLLTTWSALLSSIPTCQSQPLQKLQSTQRTIATLVETLIGVQIAQMLRNIWSLCSEDGR